MKLYNKDLALDNHIKNIKGNKKWRVKIDGNTKTIENEKYL